jgi:molybdate transport system substrate-binding protein
MGQALGSDRNPAPPPVRALVAGAAKGVIQALAPAFEAETGWRIDAAFDTVGALRDRILAGEAADVAILSREAVEAVGRQREGQAGPVVPLGRTGVGLAGRAGAAHPAVGSPEAFEAALRRATSIGYADPARGATAGRHFIGVVEALGLAERLRPRLRPFPFGVEAVAAVGRGEVELAVSQATEILGQPGLALVGLFPAPYALSTAYDAIALSATEGAVRLLQALQGPAAVEACRRYGFFEDR